MRDRSSPAKVVHWTCDYQSRVGARKFWERIRSQDIKDVRLGSWERNEVKSEVSTCHGEGKAKIPVRLGPSGTAGEGCGSPPASRTASSFDILSKIQISRHGSLAVTRIPQVKARMRERHDMSNRSNVTLRDETQEQGLTE